MSLFAGTAWYYARYRSGYPDAMIRLVIDRFGLDGSGRQLDLGCGTGQLILPFASHVEQVIGMDPDAAMLAEAERVIREAGIGNVHLVQAGSTELVEAASPFAPYRLVTMGRSFHWMDGRQVLSDLAGLLVAGGGIVITGDGCGVWSGSKPWEHLVGQTVREWLGQRRRAGTGYSNQANERWETLIPRIASPEYGAPEFHQFRYQRTWDIDSVVGHLYSTSFCSPEVLGDKREGFERELRQRLTAFDPTEHFIEDVVVDAVLLERIRS